MLNNQAYKEPNKPNTSDTSDQFDSIYQNAFNGISESVGMDKMNFYTLSSSDTLTFLKQNKFIPKKVLTVPRILDQRDYDSSSTGSIYDNCKNRFSHIELKYLAQKADEDTEDSAYRVIGQWLEEIYLHSCWFFEKALQEHFFDEETSSDYLIALGSITNKDTHKERGNLLVKMLTNSSRKIQFGALMGIADLEDSSYRGAIEEYLKNESTTGSLRNAAKAVIRQFDNE